MLGSTEYLKAMDIVFLFGRLLFSLLFIASGVMGHFVQGRDTQEYARASGAPSPEVTVPLTGAMLVAGGLSVLLGIFADAGALILFAFLVPTAFIMHPFWKVEDPQMQQLQMAQFMKNISLSGACLIVFWLYSEAADLPLSLTESLF